MRDAFNQLFYEGLGSLARKLADFLILDQVRLVFEAMSSPDVGGFVSLDDATVIHLNEAMPMGGWPAMEIAAVLAHEAHHVTQLTIEKVQQRSPVFWLEDIEGPAYVKETLVWDELRRDAGGVITSAAQHGDWDFRANTFMVGGRVDVAAHNAYIASTRGITPHTQWW
ncbi:MAG: hypothetical protein HYZ91_04330 [Candidatus Omnitrophica bacterium]|nr:hypothetical protein [Candidatus Omnitrophota bacterium]